MGTHSVLNCDAYKAIVVCIDDRAQVLISLSAAITTAMNPNKDRQICLVLRGVYTQKETILGSSEAISGRSRSSISHGLLLGLLALTVAQQGFEDNLEADCLLKRVCHGLLLASVVSAIVNCQLVELQSGF